MRNFDSCSGEVRRFLSLETLTALLVAAQEIPIEIIDFLENRYNQ